MNNLTGLLSIFASIVSVGSLIISHAMWRTSRERLRLDLYNRRFDIYSRTLDFYHTLVDYKRSDDYPELRMMQRAFIKASREAQFLFPDGSEIHQLLVEMNGISIEIIQYQSEAFKWTDKERILPLHDECSSRWQRINHKILPSLEKNMSRYLDFHALSTWRN